MRVRYSVGRKIFLLANAVFLAVLLVTMFVPFWNALVISLSSALGSVHTGITLWPRHFSLTGYRDLFTIFDFWRPLENSLIVSIVGTVAHVLLSALAGYALAQPAFPGRRVITLLIMVTMMIPFQAIMIPFYITMKQVGLINTLMSLILVGFVSGFSILLMRNFFQNIPRDLHEAAEIDGAGQFRIFWQIYLPLSKAGLATVSLFEFVGRWNNLLAVILLINNANRDTLQVALYTIINNQSATSNPTLITPNVQMAGIFLAMLPLILLYPFIQRYFVQGIFLGANKE